MPTLSIDRVQARLPEEAYRRMAPSARLALALRATSDTVPHLLAGPPEVAARRFARLRAENEARNRNLRERLATAHDHAEAAGDEEP